MEDLIKKEWNDTLERHPYLGVLEDKSSFYSSRGILEIIDSSGILWDTFEVKIEIPKIYPNLPPKIYEIGGKLPNDIDWHINSDKSCCVGTNTKIYRKLASEITIKRWLEIVVMSYFLDQVHRLEKGVYKGKIHKHYSVGLLDDYKEQWCLSSKEEVIKRLNDIVGNHSLKHYEPCFCGSNKKFKKCHRNKEEFDGIPIEVYKLDLRMIQKS